MIEKREYLDKTVYLLDGKKHREDGPAVEYDNICKEWYINGRLHREDGPAIEWYDEAVDWWINGVDLTKDVENWFKSTGFNSNYSTWTTSENLQFKLVWC